jgi:hypothetical protein
MRQAAGLIRGQIGQGLTPLDRGKPLATTADSVLRTELAYLLSKTALQPVPSRVFSDAPQRWPQLAHETAA